MKDSVVMVRMHLKFVYLLQIGKYWTNTEVSPTLTLKTSEAAEGNEKWGSKSDKRSSW